MKKIVSIAVALLIVAGAACDRSKEDKKQVVYAPVAAPADMEIKRLQEAAKAAPNKKEIWIELGNASMDAQRFNDAIEAYEKALSLDPKNVPVRVDLGTCYRGVQKYDRAVEEYRKAIKIDPAFPNAHRNLGVVLATDLHQNAEAAKELRRYLDVAPTAPDAPDIRTMIQQLSTAK
ncbi:MAG TPA: tetratricopeptide repeat protein [Nitrospirota bacterium]|nr:tetratricopeptide repeat protein [Nitrospirota bacterium]